MFREMRRKKQQISPEECLAVLDRGKSGVLAVAGEEGWPYAVPLSYARGDGKLYFHSAAAGHKLDAIGRDSRASFCVIDQDQVVPEAYTTRYRSVIVFGRVRVLADEAEMRAALTLLARKYAPAQTPEDHSAAIEKDFARVCVLELTMEHVSGKASLALVKS